MRISINAKKIEGPYGGGNQFANILEKYLQSKGHEVFRKLVPKLDLILIVSSQDNLKITSFGVEDIRDYKVLNPNVIIVHRVNTCDEPRGSDLGINDAILKANKISDYTIYVSEFIKKFFEDIGIDASKPNTIIRNAPDEEIFNQNGSSEWRLHQKMRIVTHHWSSNFMKGFDIYERLDQLLGIEPFKKLFEFTIIGNIPLGVKFANSKVIPPIFGERLANELKKNHIYLTAARNEPGPNHCAEAIACGLPVLYLKSGALPEYCGEYGIEFNLINFEEKLLEIYHKWSELKKRISNHSYTGSQMAAKYEEIFLHLISAKQVNTKVKFQIISIIKQKLFVRPYRKIKKIGELGKHALKYIK